MIHLQGMGILGCLTALKLHQHGYEFTWEDNRSEVNAWRACTGACYPSGGVLDNRCHALYLDPQWSAPLRPYLEECAYWVDTRTKSLPHSLVAEEEARVGGARLVGRSVHLNGQRLVEAVREEFAALEGSPPPGHVPVVSHGFHEGRARYLWGWTRLVKLAVHPDVLVHGRPSFYLRRNRFQFAYCYPVPRSDLWYAGSTLVHQVEAKDHDPRPYYDRWLGWFDEMAGEAAEVAEEGPYLTGWRPCGPKGASEGEGYAADRGRLLTETAHGVRYPTLATGGFRHFPAVWEELYEYLQRKTPGGVPGVGRSGGPAAVSPSASRRPSSRPR